MPVTRHVERHFTSGDTVRDIVIGMSDGLTVPALAAGLSGAVRSTLIDDGVVAIIDPGVGDLGTVFVGGARRVAVSAQVMLAVKNYNRLAR